jgi:hypothetical protein
LSHEASDAFAFVWLETPSRYFANVKCVDVEKGVFPRNFEGDEDTLSSVSKVIVKKQAARQ